MVKKFLARSGTAVLEQPPYSPSLAPCDFWLFDKLKDVMRGDNLGSIEASSTQSQKLSFSSVLIVGESADASVLQREGGEYFKGDRSVLSE